MKKQNAGLWFGGFLLIFGVIIFIQSLSFDYHNKFGPGPGFLPLWLSGALIVLTGFYIIRSLLIERVTFADILPPGTGVRKLVLVLSAMVGFILVIPYLGFVVASILLLCLLLAGAYKWYYNFLISVGISVILFWIFDTLLHVPLPVNGLGF